MEEYIRYTNISFDFILKEIYDCHNKQEYNRILAINLYYKYIKVVEEYINITDSIRIFYRYHYYDYHDMNEKFKKKYVSNTQFCQEIDYIYDEQDIYEFMIYIRILRDFFLELLKQKYYDIKRIFDDLYKEISDILKDLNIRLLTTHQKICEYILDVYLFYLVGKDFFDKFKISYKDNYGKYKVCSTLNTLIYNKTDNLDLLLEYENEPYITGYVIEYRKSIGNPIESKRKYVVVNRETRKSISDYEKNKYGDERIVIQGLIIDDDDKIYIFLKYNEIIKKLYSLYYLDEFEFSFKLAQELKLMEYLNDDSITIFFRGNQISTRDLYFYLRRFYNISSKNEIIFSIFFNIITKRKEIQEIKRTELTEDNKIEIYKLRLSILLSQKKNILYKLFYLDIEYIEKEKGEEYNKIREKILDNLNLIILNIQLYHYNLQRINASGSELSCDSFDIIINELKTKILEIINEKLFNLKDEEKRLMSIIDEYNTENKKLTQEINEINARIRYLKKRLNILNEVIPTKREELSIRITKSNSFVSKMVRKNNIDKLRTELEESIKNFSDFNTELSELKEKKLNLEISLLELQKNKEYIDEEKDKLLILKKNIKNLSEEIEEIENINISTGGNKNIKKIRNIRKYKINQRNSMNSLKKHHPNH